MSILSRRAIIPLCVCGVIGAAAGISLSGEKKANAGRQEQAIPLPTGKFITPEGTHIAVGSFPANMLLTPDGKHVVVTNTGYRQYLTVIRVEDGKVTAQLEVGAARTRSKKPEKEGLYYGLTALPAEDGKATLYASRGNEDRIWMLTLKPDGTFEGAGRFVDNPSEFADGDTPHAIAGVAVSTDGRTLYAANNHTDVRTNMQGSLSILDVDTNRIVRETPLPGFPFAVTYLPARGKVQAKVYVSSERDGVVSVVDDNGKKLRDIKTGLHAMALLLDKAKRFLYVANAGSDTVSVIDTQTDKVTQTILLRPDDARGLAGVTPTNLALSPDEKRLYVPCADMNAVAVVELPEGKLEGYIPVGWYPTAVVVSPDGSKLFVSNAKGINARNPNGKAAGPDGKWGQYIENIIEGTVAVIKTPGEGDLSLMTRRVIANNRIKPELEKRGAESFLNPGIEHVIYIIKENRTYDQVLGDMKQGNGDPSLCLFPREVSPNLHALAERFVLLDNFYVCAEVSADGWDWSTSGMISEYTARNAPYNYSGRGRNYDFEGQTNGVPVDIKGIPDVARAPSGYIWDACVKSGVSFRNYGVYCNFVSADVRDKVGGKWLGEDNHPNKKALVGRTCLDFRLYDTRYADSEAWVKYNAPAPNQIKSFGKYNDPARITTWRREFEEFVKKKNLPKFLMLRLGRDHTSGTSAGAPTPRAMVADNDYAVGQLVEAVSKSPYWKKTAIFVLEDDAQNGYDHVDAHRSIAFVISPYIKKGTVDSTFYNTDSVLRTMGLILGTSPLCQYDAVATPMNFFGSKADNNAPYEAILPAKEIATAVNKATAYRARDSKRLLNPLKEESMPDEELNDILWRSIKGRNSTPPPVRYGLQVSAKRAEED